MHSCSLQARCRRLGAAALLLALSTGTPVFAGPVKPPPPHIRIIDKPLAQFISEGCRRSSTFRRLVEQLEHSDLVVYIESAAYVPPLTRAYMRWVGASATFRFVRVAVKLPASTDRIISLLGHELHHATEVAGALDVRDRRAFEDLYLRIGDTSPGGRDTAAARHTGDAVHAELNTGVRTVPLSIMAPSLLAHASRQ